MKGLHGWTRTGDLSSRGRSTPRMADGSPNWSLPAHEPDNGPRAVAGRLLMVGAIYAALGGSFSVVFWLAHVPAVQRATVAFVTAMPGRDPVRQVLAALAVVTATGCGAAALARRLHGWYADSAGRRPADAGVLASYRAVSDAGAVELQQLLFRVGPAFLVLVALVNAGSGSERLQLAVWPLLAGALLLTWIGRRHLSPVSAAEDPPAAPPCESCGWAPGTVTVIFVDDVTFHVCARCVAAGAHRAIGSKRRTAEQSRRWHEGVQP